MIWTLFYYNSLPEMPDGCRLFSPDVVHRDLLMCNPHNTGHYQYPKFETIAYDEGCHKREIVRFLDQPDPEKYIVFYTRNVRSSGTTENVVVGYFKVGPPTMAKGLRGFAAADQVLLSRGKAIPIPYRSRGVPVSWGTSQIRPFVSTKLAWLIARHDLDISSRYRSETRAVMRRLTSRSGWSALIAECRKCRMAGNCHWGQVPDGTKLSILTRLYGKRLGKSQCCCNARACRS